MVGTASAQDSCGQVGSVYTHAIVSVPKDGLSTISLNLPIGASFVDRNDQRFGDGILSYTKQVKLEDLACPTWGLMNQGGETIENWVTVGYPFFPIIRPPSELNSFDQAWGRCTEWVTAEIDGGYLPYEVFDPPHILVPASALAPSTNLVSVVTSSDPNPMSETSPKATPVDLIIPDLPLITKIPLPSDPGQRSTKDVGRKSAGKSEPAAPASFEISDPKNSAPRPGQINSGGGVHDTVGPGSTLKSSGGHDPHASQGIGALSGQINRSQAGHDAVDPGSTPKTLEVHDPQASQRIGALIFSAFGDPWAARPSVKISREGRFTSSMSEIPPAPSHSRYIINGQTFRGGPSFLAVDDKTITPGGAAVTVSGTLLRLDSGGNLVVDTSTLKLANLLSTPSPSVYTVNGQTFTGNSSFLAVGG